MLQRGQASLWPGAQLAVDIDRFESEAEAALGTGDPDACADAAALYGGELLPDHRYEDWAEERRRHLRARYLRLLRRAGLWEPVVSEEPTDELASRMLMRMYAGAGNRSAALEQFHQLRTALAQLGFEPSEETRELYREVAHAPPPNCVTSRPSIFG